MYATSLMVIDNFNVRRPRGSVRPLKAHAPLNVDAKAVLAFAVAIQGFEPVARPAKVSERGCGIELGQSVLGLPLEAGKGSDPFLGNKIPSPLASVADDHS